MTAPPEGEGMEGGEAESRKLEGVKGSDPGCRSGHAIAREDTRMRGGTREVRRQLTNGE